MRKRVLAWLLTAAVLVTLLPAAFADGEITSTNPPTTWADGTYTVPENVDVSINQRVTVSGSVTLTLAAGCTLTVTGGIQVNAGSSLTINGTGTLIADASGRNFAAGIGGGGGDSGAGAAITIEGGTVTAKGGDYGAGIGGSGGPGGTITINGGAVNASGGDYGAGINGSTITITGGAVEAEGGIQGAGIGGGNLGAGGAITITGGNVNATGGSGGGAAIGGGYGGDGGSIIITGGAVNATGGSNAAGIGGGSTGAGGSITITGGAVTANGGSYAAGIGRGWNTSPDTADNGSFSTPAGSAFIVAAGGNGEAAISDSAGKTSWSGVIFEGDAGKVYGSPALGTDAAIPTGKTLTIESGKTLTIGNNVTLTNEGAIINNGTLTNKGAITNTNNGTLTNNGAIAVKTGGAITGGTIAGGGTLTYEVVVNNGTGSGDYAENAPVTITAAVPDGGRFINWTVDTGGAALADANSSTTSFTMPAQPVSVTANFEIPTYAVTVQTDGNGTASASPAAAAAGTTVTLSAAPNAGYHFKQWQVVPGTVSVTGSSFTMPGENVTVTAIFEADPVQPAVHTHVWAGDWSRDASCHWHECVAPGCDISDNSQKDSYAAHTPGGWIVDFWPTASTPGQQHIECTVCGYVIQAAVLPATGGSTGGSSGSSSGGYTPPTYRPDVTPPGRGGSAAAVSPSRPERGDTVTVTPRPDEGYEVDKITVTDRGGASVEVTQNPDGTFSFTQPGGSVTIEVTYRPAEQPWSSPFSDVSEGSWYREAVRFVQENGLMNGYSDGLFRPNDTLSRAQLAQILHNKEGRPGVNYLLTFSDVSGGAWYTEAIRWAASQRIVGGYGDGRLNPGGQATRGEAAQMLKAFLEAGEHN